MDDKSRFRVRITEAFDKKPEPQSDVGGTIAVVIGCLIFGGLIAMAIASAAVKFH